MTIFYNVSTSERINFIGQQLNNLRKLENRYAALQLYHSKSLFSKDLRKTWRLANRAPSMKISFCQDRIIVWPVINLSDVENLFDLEYN